jgi:hypothetical protein
VVLVHWEEKRKPKLTESALNRHSVRPYTENDGTGCCNNKICPPEDEHSTARNMLRIIM